MFNLKSLVIGIVVLNVIVIYMFFKATTQPTGTIQAESYLSADEILQEIAGSDDADADEKAGNKLNCKVKTGNQADPNGKDKDILDQDDDDAGDQDMAIDENDIIDRKIDPDGNNVYKKDLNSYKIDGPAVGANNDDVDEIEIASLGDADLEPYIDPKLGDDATIDISGDLSDAIDYQRGTIKDPNRREIRANSPLVEINPFNLLYYSRKTVKDFMGSEISIDGPVRYDQGALGLKNNSRYCFMTDLYNLANRTNVFDRISFFADYETDGIVRATVMQSIGYDTMPKVSIYMPSVDYRKRKYKLDPLINIYFTKRVTFHLHYKIGQEAMCATQIYGHIPGHGALKSKDLIVGAVNQYEKRFEDKPECFASEIFFPKSYRLFDKEECDKFFEIINSADYEQAFNTNSYQYLIKIGQGAHRASGVFLLNQEYVEELKNAYDMGEACGEISMNLVAQTYIQNPLLLDKNNKFDFRVYMLIASVNPMIAYYHDGFLRVSLETYDKFSNVTDVHLTNTHLAKQKFEEAAVSGKYNGMTEDQLRDYQMWTFDQLQKYLLTTKKITDPNWIESYLRPKFKKAFIHTVRMSEHYFSKESNFYELFGLDFMLDDQFNLWFIECNASPQLVGTNPLKTEFLVRMLTDMFKIQVAFYRSRMKRVFDVIDRLQYELDNKFDVNMDKYYRDFDQANKNYLEEEFADMITHENSFSLIIDRNLKGGKAYMGILPEQCVDDA